jgi:peptidoglycan/xylan/chitin deacetylase (PgdA/CDA1 family)
MQGERARALGRWLAAAAGLAVALAAYGLGSRLSGAASRPAPLIIRAPITERVLALTFDDGPTAKWTPPILRVLRQNHVAATFFVIGRQAQRYPALIAQEVRDGLEVGSHGYNHMVLRGKSAQVVAAEVDQAGEAIMAAGAPLPTLYRMPAGIYDQTALSVLGGLHYLVVGWSIDPRDWRHRYAAGAMAQLVETQAEPGAIIIFHDGPNGGRATVQAVEQLIPALKRAGYRFLTVSAMLKLVKGRL